jgi:hypothetical protein
MISALLELLEFVLNCMIKSPRYTAEGFLFGSERSFYCEKNPVATAPGSDLVTTAVLVMRPGLATVRRSAVPGAWACLRP